MALAFLVSPPFSCPSPARWACTASRVLLVRDHLIVHAPPWYAWLPTALPVPFSVAPIPNPYESNSKRWERVWLSALREVASPGDILLGHGSGADVVLRYLEGDSAEGALLVLPSGDEYFAGERHGRRYHWEGIKRNVGDLGIRVVVSTATAEREENENLVKMLDVTSAVHIAKERGRLETEDRVDEVLHQLLPMT